MNSSSVNGIDRATARTTAGQAAVWKVHALSLAVVLAGVGILYLDTFVSIVRIWLSSDTYIHGFLILPLCIYLVYLQWPTLKLEMPKSYGPGLAGLIVLSLGWWLCNVLGIQVGQQFIAIAFIPMAIVTIFGVDVSRKVSFALCYLLFAVPFGEALIPWLMDFTAWFTVGALELSGIPIFSDGHFFTIPAGSFEVAKACSGIRYLISGVALGALYSYMIYNTNSKRLIFIAFSIVLAIVANGVRAYGIVLIAHFSDMRLAVGVDHIIYGWIFFGVVIGIMFWVGNKFRDDEPRPGRTDVPAAAPKNGLANSDTPFGLVATTVLIIASLALGPLVMPRRIAASDLGMELSAAVPESIAGWDTDLEYDAIWEPYFSGDSENVMAKYTSNYGIVDFAIYQYRNQSQDSELANARNFIADPDEWDIRRTTKISPAGHESGAESILATVVYGQSERRLIWYWYDVNGAVATSTFDVKLLEARALLQGEPVVSSIVAMSTTFTDEPVDAESVLNQFYDASWDLIRDCLRVEKPSTGCQSVSRIAE